MKQEKKITKVTVHGNYNIDNPWRDERPTPQRVISVHFTIPAHYNKDVVYQQENYEVVVIIAKNGGTHHDAPKSFVAQVAPIAKHYRKYLNGDTCPKPMEGLHTVELQYNEDGTDFELPVQVSNQARVDIMRDIIKNGYRKVEGVLVDTFSASAFVQIYERTSTESKTKLNEWELPRAINACFTTINKINARVRA